MPVMVSFGARPITVCKSSRLRLPVFALMALTTLFTVYVVHVWLCVSAYIQELRRRSYAVLLATLLFLANATLSGALAPNNAQLLQHVNYTGAFIMGFYEECVKAGCLLLYCTYLHHTALLNIPFRDTAIWPFTLFIALLETSKVFFSPIVTTLTYLAVMPLAQVSVYTVPAISYFSATGLTLLGFIALCRIANHFLFTWCFIAFWQAQKKAYSLMLAAAHGALNIAALYIAVHYNSKATDVTVAMHLTLVVMTYAATAAIMLYVTRRIRTA